MVASRAAKGRFRGRYRLVFPFSAAAFLVWTAAAGTGVLHPLDSWIFGLAQKTSYGLLDVVGGLTSLLGGVEFVTVAMVVLAAGLVWGGERSLALRLLVAYVVTGLIEIAAKSVVPQAPVNESAIRGPDPSMFDLATSYPYPSGHMLRTVLLLGALYVLWPSKPGRVAILIFLAAAAVSRVYLGTHWPSDVVGGALLGVAALAWAFGPRAADAHRSVKDL